MTHMCVDTVTRAAADLGYECAADELLAELASVSAEECAEAL